MSTSTKLFDLKLLSTITDSNTSLIAENYQLKGQENLAPRLEDFNIKDNLYFHLSHAIQAHILAFPTSQFIQVSSL